MKVFVTGGTGFIGARLVKKFIQQQPDLDEVFVLVRPTSLIKAEQRFQDILADPQSAEKLTFIEGNLREPLLGVSAPDIERLTGQITDFFHLGAIYDLKADRESQLAVNVQGTRYATNLGY